MIFFGLARHKNHKTIERTHGDNKKHWKQGARVINTNGVFVYQIILEQVISKKINRKHNQKAHNVARELTFMKKFSDQKFRIEIEKWHRKETQWQGHYKPF